MKTPILLIAMSMALVLGGCASSGGISRSGDSSKCANCAAKNKARLQSMIADRENKWVSDRSYKTGQITSTVRLLAYLGSLNQLDCTQLFIGKLETDVSVSALKKMKNAGRTENVGPLLTLAAKTNRAITGRQKNRCDGVNPKS